MPGQKFKLLSVGELRQKGICGFIQVRFQSKLNLWSYRAGNWRRFPSSLEDLFGDLNQPPGGEIIPETGDVQNIFEDEIQDEDYVVAENHVPPHDEDI